MTDYTGPLGKWWLEHKAKYTVNGVIDSLAMLRAREDMWLDNDHHMRRSIQICVQPLNLPDSVPAWPQLCADVSHVRQSSETAEAQLAEARKDSARLRERIDALEGAMNPQDVADIDAALAESQPKESE